ncbi:chaperone NapD [Dongia sedimenti]|uniref:Chaperone NapD n=1 Tax=Dongia sedimenti TaxID=3064282 RepID=A0ABU0YGQ3_9PROT|nr:chaperone NapD [Rhodospirillaceae bacterium R-7]
MPDTVHISSLVVHVRPERCAAIRAAIGRLEGAEVHAGTEDGKLVVVLETPSEAETLARIAAINDMQGTIAASLIYHEIDGDSEETSHA